MTKFKFLRELESTLRDLLPEEKVLEICTQAEDVFSEYEDDISTRDEDIKSLNRELKTAKADCEQFQEDILQLEGEDRFVIPARHDNMITKGVMTDLFNNLDYIPVPELETLINKYKVV